jgi:hypothetical protein
MTDRFFCKSFCVLVLSLLLVGATATALPALNQFGTLYNNQTVPTVPFNVAADTQALTETSGTFVEGVLPDLTKVPGMWTMVDPALLYLGPATTAIEMYDIGDGASYRNTVGISIAQDYALNPGDAQVVFHDASLPGDPDYQDPTTEVQGAGALSGKLDFFLIADGATPGATTYDLYWTDTSVAQPVMGANVNPDGLQHSVAFIHSSGHFVLYGWEDLPQLGDMDFNDVFVLLGANDRIIIVPEPATYLMMGSLLVVAFFVARRKRAVAYAKK